MKLALFFHAKLWGPGIPDESLALEIYLELLEAILASGLSSAASQIVINAEDEGLGEYPTLRRLQSWIPRHPGWGVCYLHTKGVTHPGDPDRRWRRCMSRAVIGEWRICAGLLEKGYDTVGAHWLTHARYPQLDPRQQYWGGNFWWARSDYLLTLPPLVPTVTNGRYYEGEAWIGNSPRPPRVYDFEPHWPMTRCR